MAVRPVLRMGDPRLLRVARRVEAAEANWWLHGKVVRAGILREPRPLSGVAGRIAGTRAGTNAQTALGPLAHLHSAAHRIG